MHLRKIPSFYDIIHLDVMRRTEMLWFEDVSAVNEPVLSFPVIGRISMRQFFILGIAGMASYGLFSATHGPASAVPISIGAFLALVKPKVGSTEWMIFSSVLFFARKMRILLERRPLTPKKSKAGCAKGQDYTRTIIMADLSRPFRFRTRLVGKAGQPIACRRARVFLDSRQIDLLTTDANGELEAVIVPYVEGKKRITVYVEDQKEPAFAETVEVRTSQ
ncbi:MAG: hypothetical protein KGI33_08950 [Thaumarchaeota archaeon]|nr:hypothetical protein [Nitrososphaerota archaeon]